MEKRDYSKLQNGSDIRGVATEGFPGEIPNLTSTEAIRIAKGFLLWLCEKTNKVPSDLKISIGRDPRITGMELKYGLLNGFGPYDVEVLDCGLASTPAMFMSTLFPGFKCDGAIMITASHLPFNRNGFKFFDKEGGLDKKDISAILRNAESDERLAKLTPFLSNKPPETSRMTQYPGKPVPLMDAYCDHLINLIRRGVNHSLTFDKPLTGMKIVVDAGNGSGGFYATKVLEPLGADISGSQFLKPDGRFPNHAPNPEDKDAIASICDAVKKTGADLGIIFDTDVDRSAAVDNNGKEIARNGIVAMAASLVAERFPGTTIVTDSITSTELTDFLENTLELKHLRFKRGYKNVINKAIELNAAGEDCQLAIETSGHAAMKENHFLDDGAYLATKIVIKAAKLFAIGKTIDTVLEDLKEPAEAEEVRIPIRGESFAEIGDKVITELSQWAKNYPGMELVQPNYEGVRIAFDMELPPQRSASQDADENAATRLTGWCLLRKSLHDPLLPLNVESSAKGGCRKIYEFLYGFLSQYQELDIAPLKEKLT
ncbi:MAG: phosphomannomutase/phosphoglucomutase [Firmicutes bacterium]|nr:phosphomannomutase/phosphoglucomutase [Bacillota bacterium]